MLFTPAFDPVDDLGLPRMLGESVGFSSGQSVLPLEELGSWRTPRLRRVGLPSSRNLAAHQFLKGFVFGRPWNWWKHNFAPLPLREHGPRLKAEACSGALKHVAHCSFLIEERIDDEQFLSPKARVMAWFVPCHDYLMHRLLSRAVSGLRFVPDPRFLDVAVLGLPTLPL